jgi:prepilin-type N-terminal cleavage/methylation domain-containing protein
MGAVQVSETVKTNSGRQSGFTLIEALISSVIVAVCVMAVSAAFYGGFQNLEDEGAMIEKVNYAAGKMDELIATDFARLSGGNDNVTVSGEQVYRSWQVSSYDVDGSPGAEPDAKLIVVTVGDVELVTLLVDSGGRVTCKR